MMYRVLVIGMNISQCPHRPQSLSESPISGRNHSTASKITYASIDFPVAFRDL